MPLTAPWAEAAKALADKVTVNGAEWHEAVCVTPRHLLVPRWWERVPDSPAEEWELVAHAEDAPARIAAAYSDTTLVTRVGPRHADHAEPDEKASGSPTSSSTLPGLIVSMMRRLDTEPGHRVLDVGTGSGYALALFAHRLGDDHVTSVDVDPYLVAAARARLAAFGRTPRIETGDATGALPDSAYDRIMATVSVRPVAAVGPVPDLWREWSLRWLYELDTPGVETRAARMPDGRRVLWLLAADGSWARAEETGPGRAAWSIGRPAAAVGTTWNGSGACGRSGTASRSTRWPSYSARAAAAP